MRRGSSVFFVTAVATTTTCVLQKPRRSFSSATTHTVAPFTADAAVPEGTQLHHVVVVHRHGDRAPVTRSIGPKYPPSTDVEALWRGKLISGANEALLKAVATAQRDDDDDDDTGAVTDDLYHGGRDAAGIPYGQLTDKGSEQLQALGRALRSRYVGGGDTFLPPTVPADAVYARTTNMCRTMNSLRSLLAGLYGLGTPDDVARRRAEDAAAGHGRTFPRFLSLPVGSDPMIDGPCDDPARKDEVRKRVIEAHGIPSSYPHDYAALDARMKAALGFTDRVNWLQIREQLVCMQSHGVPFPDGLDDADVDRLYGLEMWIVQCLFGDPEYNALAIGAFYSELHDRLVDVKVGTAAEKLSIYSAHDYTLIPFMQGLGILPPAFPHYAAYVVLEIAADVPATTGTDKPTTFVVRCIYNGESIHLPGCDRAWVPMDVLLQRLQEGATGKATRTAPDEEKRRQEQAQPHPQPQPQTPSHSKL